MSHFARLAVRSPQPFDIVGDRFLLCGLGSAFEGVVGSARLTDRNGAVLAEISPMFVPAAALCSPFSTSRLHTVCLRPRRGH
jgi:hypothetical protein